MTITLYFNDNWEAVLPNSSTTYTSAYLAGDYSQSPYLSGYNAQTNAVFAYTGQTVNNVFSSRSSGVTYYNTTFKTMYVLVSLYANATKEILGYVNSVLVSKSSSVAFASNGMCVLVVPPKGNYSVVVETGGTIQSWTEIK